jgi:tetratricopeptide (TPR) repeat protein
VRVWPRVIAVIAVLGSPVGAAQAASTNSEVRALVERAVESYATALDTPERGARLEAFRQAERLFSRAVDQGVASADLYTNWGNAALQAEHLGTAVLAYRRALAQDPDQTRSTQNLEHARTLLPGWVPKPETDSLVDTFFFWHRASSRSDRALAGALAFACAALLVAVALRSGQSAWRTAAFVPALVWAVLVVSVLVESSQGAGSEAVVIAEETIARAADSALAPRTLPAPLPGGVEVRVLELRPPWLRVRLANGRDAWIAASAVAWVTPSVENRP